MGKKWVDVDAHGNPVEIFDSMKLAIHGLRENHEMRLMDESEAKSSIRRAIYHRQKGRCLDCGKILTEKQIHMHERLARGKFDENGLSGNISLDNSVGLCFNSHINIEHGDRKPRWGAQE